MSSDTIRVGFLGASTIAHKVWAAIEAAGNMQVTLVGSRSVEVAQKFVDECTENLHISEERKAAAATYDEVVGSSNVDVVYMSIPVTTRHEWVMKCAANNKHVVGEKPPASTPEQLQSWIEALSAKGLLYMDGTMFSHGPYVKKVVECLPEIGDIRRMTFIFSFRASPERLQNDIRCNPDLEPLGALGDIGWYGIRSFLHMVDFVMPTTVAGRILEELPNGAVTSFKGELFFPGAKPDTNIYAYFYCSFLSSLQQSFIVSGTKGRIVAEQLTNPLTDAGAACFTIVKPMFSGPDPNTDVTVEQTVTKVQVPEETGHMQETQMWRDVRDCLRKDESGRLIAEEDAVREWARKSWMTHCIAAKLMESARSSL
ncbi:oxidoreductase-like protein [Leishmania major strain Friedlin]|uniref:Oxidoreductase-like protein n=1 Tax=Leishmania major TaxID=5664 RepID=Q4QBB6_LEIMA|nr:oxidoreductase-like protein [Leishmania major strain Friedlin]CAG9574192.1 oxidoreductase-like_protein [Leishmania major strain Friedlin]CAJ04234.1 oxidoreductase-like protein [Leishmania major strain Friedlin]|eukprot:XP_001683382.1 oxidoreductase-like protein [Leishmania major strain Friedlin]